VSFLILISQLIDGFTRVVGKCVAWLVLGAVVICALNAAVLKFFGNTSAFLKMMDVLHLGANSFIEIQWYLYAGVFLLGSGYTLLNQEHVKIDVISGRFSKTTQIWIDIFGLCVFLFPFVLLVIYLSVPLTVTAYNSNEMSGNAGGLIRWPVYALVPLGFSLLGLQALSELIKRFAFLAGRIPDPTQKPQGKSAEEELAEFLLKKEVAAREAQAAAVLSAGAKK
jgi:TRAP-type mannitol/chloroaromatic compound transport system permease small subunit